MPCKVLKILVRKLKIEQQELHQKRGLTHVLWTGYEFLAAPLVKSVVQLNFDNIHIYSNKESYKYGFISVHCIFPQTY